MINLCTQRSSKWNPPKSLNKSQFLFFPIKHFRKIPSDRKSRYLSANGHEELNSSRSVMMRKNYDTTTKKVSLVIPLYSLWCALVVKLTNSQFLTWLIATTFHQHYHHKSSQPATKSWAKVKVPGIVFSNIHPPPPKKLVALLWEESESICNIGEEQQQPKRSVVVNWVSDAPRLCFRASFYRNQGRLWQSQSECTRAKFPIIHDFNFQNQYSVRYVSLQRLI